MKMKEIYGGLMPCQLRGQGLECFSSKRHSMFRNLSHSPMTSIKQCNGNHEHCLLLIRSTFQNYWYPYLIWAKNANENCFGKVRLSLNSRKRKCIHSSWAQGNMHTIIIGTSSFSKHKRNYFISFLIAESLQTFFWSPSSWFCLHLILF